MRRGLHFATLKTIVSFISLLPLYAVPPSEEANPSGRIVGKIAEEGTLDPMEYTTISVYSLADSTLVGGTISDPDGNFEIRRLPMGEYYIVTNYVGYSERIIAPASVDYKGAVVDLGTVELSVNTEVLQEVEIVADRKHVEYRLDKKVVNVSQDINATGGTVVDVLENTPSVSVDIEGNVSLRGSGSFTVLIDGKPTVLEGSDALQQIPASAVENIEIITNPSAKYDPDGNSGIINVVMKRRVTSGITGIINGSAGLNNKYRFDGLINRKAGKWNFFVGGNYNNNLYAGDLTREQITFTDTFDKHLDATGAFDFRRSGAQLKGGLTYDFSERSSLSLEASGGNYGFSIDRSNRSHEYTIPGSGNTYYVSKSIMQREGTYFSINASFNKTFDSKDHRLLATGYLSSGTGNSEDIQDDYNTDESFNLEDVVASSSRGMESEDEIEARFQVDYTKPLGENGKLEAGYQARIDDESEYYSFREFDPVVETWYENSLYSSSLDFFRNIQGAYLTYAGQLRKFQYQLGLRGEYTFRSIDHERSSEIYQINRMDYYPTIHLTRELKNDQQLMLSYSKRVDRPRGYYLDPNISYVDPYTIRVGNPALQPEYIHSAELGYQKGWGSNYLAFEIYYRNTRNLISRVTEYDDSLDLFIFRTENLNSDHSAGGELMANWKFGKWLTVNGSITPYYYRLKGEINDVNIDRQSFNWRSNLNTTFQISPTTRLQTNMAYRSKSVSPQGTIKGYYYMNLAFRQDLFDRKLSATVQFRDIFGSIKRDMFNSGENFQQKVLMVREPRVLTLTLSYKINNFRYNPRERGGESAGGGMDFGGGL